MRADKIAGVSLAIVDRAGVVMARGYGAATFDPYRKADADTLFRVGSISKTLVWIAIMQLVEEGKLSLDDPISDRLPPALRIPEDGFHKPILVRHLMTHSAGFEELDRGPVCSRRPTGGAATMVLDALILVWLAAGALLLVGARSWAGDKASFLYTYPGDALPNRLLGAACRRRLDPGCGDHRLPPISADHWSPWLWIRNGVTLAVYAALIATLFEWRLLGFS